MDITLTKIIVAILFFVVVSLLVLWVYRLLRLRKRIEEYRKYWDAERGNNSELIYVALGDSAAQGIGASSPATSYVSLIGDYISEVTGKSVKIVNISKTGAKLGDVIDTQLSQLSAYNPDFITVDIGGNDILGFSEERFHAEIKDICGRLPKRTLISDIPYFMHGKAEVNAGAASCFLSDQAKDNNHIFIELHQSLRDRGWKAMITDFAPDWFHPNDSGYRVWFESFKPGIDVRIKELGLEKDQF